MIYIFLGNNVFKFLSLVMSLVFFFSPVKVMILVLEYALDKPNSTLVFANPLDGKITRTFNKDHAKVKKKQKTKKTKIMLFFIKLFYIISSHFSKHTNNC